MKIDHVHFFVEDAKSQRDWFVHHMGCQAYGVSLNAQTRTEVLQYGSTDFFVSSPLSAESPVAHHLRCHAPGVVDIAVQVKNLDSRLSRASTFLISPQTGILENQSYRWATIQGWGSIRHTLIEHPRRWPFRYVMKRQQAVESVSLTPARPQIDHIVLNVPRGELSPAVRFYQDLFGLEAQQQFQIETSQSGLKSQVLYSPSGQVYFNINEPVANRSQIQVFLDANCGAGIQHIALRTQSLWAEVVKLRGLGLPFLPIPSDYYRRLQDRLQLIPSSSISVTEWRKIVAQEILVDWQSDKPDALLFQIFSKPIFSQPTFFFEFLERRAQVKGFGARNFQMLYEAVEAEFMHLR